MSVSVGRARHVARSLAMSAYIERRPISPPRRRAAHVVVDADTIFRARLHRRAPQSTIYGSRDDGPVWRQGARLNVGVERCEHTDNILSLCKHVRLSCVVLN